MYSPRVSRYGLINYMSRIGQWSTIIVPAYTVNTCNVVIIWREIHFKVISPHFFNSRSLLLSNSHIKPRTISMVSAKCSHILSYMSGEFILILQYTGVCIPLCSVPRIYLCGFKRTKIKRVQCNLSLFINCCKCKTK